MEKHSLNIEMSKTVYRACRKQIVQKQCYLNIFHAAMHYSEKVTSGEWKIAYGYFSITGFDKLLARHCFFLDEEDRVIDPTLFARSDIARNPDYYVMKVFSTYSDYLHALNEADGYPDLCRTLRPLEQQVYLWASEHGFALCG